MRSETQRGFTLIEALVSLAIAGLVLAALFSGAASGLHAVGMAARTTEALSHARSRLAALGVGQPLTPSVREDDDGGGFHWREVVTRRAGGESGSGLYDVTVEISWNQAGAAGAVRLVSRRVTGPDGRVR